MALKIKTIIIFLVVIFSAQGSEYVPGEVLIRFVRGVVEIPPGQQKAGIEAIQGSVALENYLSTLGLQEISKVFPNFSAGDTLTTLEDGSIVHTIDLSLVFKLTFPPEVAVQSIVDSLNVFTEVIYAEPNGILQIYGTPNDPLFGEQWALKQGSNDCDIDADLAWDIETGSDEIKIGILDTGIDYDHSDLGAGFGIGHKVSGGWDYFYDDADPMDIGGHGTHVAGIASALTHNGYGIAGLSGGWGGGNIGCQLLAFRIGVYEMINMDDAVVAIQEAADPSEYGVHVLNASWGDYEYRETLREAICYVYQLRKTFVAAKGPRNTSNPSYPADYDQHWVLSVGATDQDDQRWVEPTGGSDYGNGIDVVAPGVEILSTALTSEPPPWKTMTGTSMATAHVSGLAALIRSMALAKMISLHTEDVQGIIRATAEDKGSPGYDDYYGAGRINAYDALRCFNYKQALRRYTVSPTDFFFYYYDQKTFIGVSGLADGTYNVQQFVYYRDIWLPADTLKFLGIWGLGRHTTGYSVADPNYGEGFCGASEIPYLPGCYTIFTNI